MYKPSRYNIVFQSDDDTFLFNTRTSAFLKINSRSVGVFSQVGSGSAFEWITEEPPAFDLDDLELSDDILDTLHEGGFLVPEDVNELDMMKIASLTTRYSMDSITLTVVTTHSCNFDCGYCYEEKVQPKMSVDVQEKLLAFVETQKNDLKNISVTWFGGEPLLGRDVIQRLSIGFIEICKENNISYTSDIITNGYLLTRPVAQELADLGVQGAQITLDGVAETHDERRPHISGCASFERIVDNIADVYDLISIVIRMNLDPSISDSAFKLIDNLAERGLTDKIQLSFAPVHNDGKGCQERDKKVQSCQGCAKPKTELFTLKSFCDLQMKLYNYSLEKGFPFLNLPMSKSNACTADLANSYVIEPNGTLQKCWQTVADPDENIGDVFTGTRLNNRHSKWLLYDPFSLDKCKSCRVLPVCLGWCPFKIMADSSPESCSYVKHTIVNDLMLYSQTQQNQVLPVKRGSS